MVEYAFFGLRRLAGEQTEFEYSFVSGSLDDQIAELNQVGAAAEAPAEPVVVPPRYPPRPPFGAAALPGDLVTEEHYGWARDAVAKADAVLDRARDHRDSLQGAQREEVNRARTDFETALVPFDMVTMFFSPSSCEGSITPLASLPFTLKNIRA